MNPLTHDFVDLTVVGFYEQLKPNNNSPVIGAVNICSVTCFFWNHVNTVPKSFFFTHHFDAIQLLPLHGPDTFLCAVKSEECNEKVGWLQHFVTLESFRGDCFTRLTRYTPTTEIFWTGTIHQSSFTRIYRSFNQPLTNHWPAIHQSTSNQGTILNHSSLVPTENERTCQGMAFEFSQRTVL